MHRWEARSKDSLKPIGPSGECHSPQIFQSPHHERGATSDFCLLVKLADSDLVTLDRASTILHVYSTVAMG